MGNRGKQPMVTQMSTHPPFGAPREPQPVKPPEEEAWQPTADGRFETNQRGQIRTRGHVPGPVRRQP